MALDDSYADMVPVAPADDSTIPVGSTPVPDGDGDGDDFGSSRLGDFCPGVMGTPT